METMTELLGSHPFFAGLSPSAVELIAGCASNVHFAEGDQIFDEGKPANIFYVIRHGRVALEVYSLTKGPLVIDTMNVNCLGNFCRRVPRPIDVRIVIDQPRDDAGLVADFVQMPLALADGGRRNLSDDCEHRRIHSKGSDNAAPELSRPGPGTTA